MEDEFLLLEEESALDNGKAKGSSPTKWVVSLALLLLVPALVITMVLSTRVGISGARFPSKTMLL